MTENGEAYENHIVERINGILKTEFKLNRVFQSRTQEMLEVSKSIESYNQLRPQMSCNYLNPMVAHTHGRASDQAVEKLSKKVYQN